MTRRLTAGEAACALQILKGLCGVGDDEGFILLATGEGFSRWQFTAFPEQVSVRLELDAEFALGVAKGVIREQASERLERARTALRRLAQAVQEREDDQILIRPEPRLRPSSLACG